MIVKFGKYAYFWCGWVLDKNIEHKVCAYAKYETTATIGNC